MVRLGEAETSKEEEEGRAETRPRPILCQPASTFLSLFARLNAVSPDEVHRVGRESLERGARSRVHACARLRRAHNGLVMSL